HVDSWLLSWGPGSAINATADAYLVRGVLTLALAAAAIVPAPSALRRRSLDLWRALAGLLDALAIMALLVAVAAIINGPGRLRFGTVVVLSVRQGWRAWALLLLIVAARAAPARRGALAPCRWARRARAR